MKAYTNRSLNHSLLPFISMKKAYNHKRQVNCIDIQRSLKPTIVDLCARHVRCNAYKEGGGVKRGRGKKLKYFSNIYN